MGNFISFSGDSRRAPRAESLGQQEAPLIASYLHAQIDPSVHDIFLHSQRWQNEQAVATGHTAQPEAQARVAANAIDLVSQNQLATPETSSDYGVDHLAIQRARQSILDAMTPLDVEGLNDAQKAA